MKRVTMGLVSCPNCGNMVSENAKACPKCKTPRSPARKPTQPSGADPVLRMLLPVGRSGWAIAAGYLRLFSVLCVPAPLALLVGIVAVMDLQRHPDRHGMGRAIFGIVMGLAGSLGLLALIPGLLSR